MFRDLNVKWVNPPSSPFFEMELVPTAKKAVWRANTGHLMAEDKFIDTQAARQRLIRQTDMIVDRLADVWKATEGRWGAKLRLHSDLSLVCTEKDVSRPLPGFAHQVFLPIMAHDARSGLVKEFQLWMERHQHTRYYVITTGGRCGIGELAGRFKWLHEQIQEFRRWLKDTPEYNGIEVVLRCDEFTMRREMDMRTEKDGTLSFHPHTNLAIHFPFLIGGRNLDQQARSAAFLRFKTRMDAFFGAMVQDCGEIKNPRELIKYMCKYEKDASADGTIGILDVTPTELAEIYAVRRGLKPVQTMGDFRKFRGGLRRDRKKVISRWFDGLGQFKLTTYQMPPVKEKVLDEQLFEKKNTLGKNQIIAITDPSPWHDCTSRPALVVRNFDGNFSGLRYANKLEPLTRFVADTVAMRAIERATKAGAGVSAYWLDTFTETPEAFFSETTTDCVWDDDPPPEMVLAWADEHEPPPKNEPNT